MLKSDLRKILINKRKSIINKSYKDHIIKDKVLRNKYVTSSKNILIYVSFGEEVNTHSLIKELWNKKKNVYVPKVINKEILFYKINSFNDLIIGKFNILEPTTEEVLDNYDDCVIIVPGLTFDKDLNRLGYGGGYYDKFLNNKDIYKIGVCYKELLMNHLNCEKHDIKMNVVISD